MELYRNKVNWKFCLLLKVPKVEQLQLINDMGKMLELKSDFANEYDMNSLVFRTPEAVTPDCLLCLGILQKIDSPDYVQQLAKEVTDSKYEFETFKLTIKTPLAPYIRYAHVKDSLILSY